MLISPSTLEHLELILAAALSAAVLLATIVAVVGSIAYVVFREPHDTGANPKVVADNAPMAPRHAA